MGLSPPSYNGREGLERRGMRMLRSLCSGPIAGRNEAYIALGAGSWACQLEGRGGEQSAGWGGGRPRPPGKPRSSQAGNAGLPFSLLPERSFRGLAGLRPSGCVPPRAESSWPRRALLLLPVLSEPFSSGNPGSQAPPAREASPPGIGVIRRVRWKPATEATAGRRTWDEGRGVSFTLYSCVTRAPWFRESRRQTR